jgi:hypothetical protein
MRLTQKLPASSMHTTAGSVCLLFSRGASSLIEAPVERNSTKLEQLANARSTTGLSGRSKTSAPSPSWWKRRSTNSVHLPSIDVTSDFAILAPLRVSAIIAVWSVSLSFSVDTGRLPVTVGVIGGIKVGYSPSFVQSRVNSISNDN